MFDSKMFIILLLLPVVALGQTVGPETRVKFHNSTRQGDEVEMAVGKAAAYILGSRYSDNSWGTWTPRAVVALMFSKNIVPISGIDQTIIKQQLNIKILMDMFRVNKPTASSLALYANSLYATCQNPQNFEGMNLISLLRSEADAMTAHNLTSPLVFLTLCLANELRSEDYNKLHLIYQNAKSDQAGTKSLAVMAYKCMEDKFLKPVARYAQHFFESYKGLESSNIDVYTKALYIQASNAWGRRMNTRSLLNNQLPDGSFGDLLATYYAIPALMNSSLLKLKCETSSRLQNIQLFEGISSENLLMKPGATDKKLSFSLWIESDADVVSHTMNLTIVGNVSFFDVMLMASTRDPTYRFQYDDLDAGVTVYSLAGIPNDVETGRRWVLYAGKNGRISLNSERNLQEMTTGVNKIYPAALDHFVFWLKRDG